MTKCKNDLINEPANIFLRYSSFPGGARVESGYENGSPLKLPVIVFVGWGWGHSEGGRVKAAVQLKFQNILIHLGVDIMKLEKPSNFSWEVC